MAINLLTQYPGKVGPVVPGVWPYGEPRNVTVPGDGTGTPWEVALGKDIIGLQQAMLTAAGIVPSGTPEQVGTCQYLQAMSELIMGRAGQYIASGTVNSIILTAGTNQESIQSLYVGLTVKFVPFGNSQGTITINVAGTGFIVARDAFGTNLDEGAIVSGREAVIVYNGVNWVVTNPLYNSAQIWTPELYGTTSGPGVRPTYITQDGYAIRINDFIAYEFNLVINTIGGVLGNIRVDGFPFGLKSGSASLSNSDFIDGRNFTLNTNYHSLKVVPVGATDSDAFDLLQQRDIHGAGLNIPLTHAELSSVATFRVSGFATKT